MNAEIIKLSEDEIEVDGVVYKRQSLTLEEKIEGWCRKINREKEHSSHDIATHRKENGEYKIVLELPQANSDWTFEVFDWTRRTVEHFKEEGYGSYPMHHPCHKGTEINILIR